MKRKIAAILAGAIVATGLTTAPASAASSGSAGGVSHPDVVLYYGQHNKTANISYSVKNPTSAQIQTCFAEESYPEYGEVYTGWGGLDWAMDIGYHDRYGNAVGGGAFLYSGEDARSGKATSTRWYDWEEFGKYTARATVERSFEVYVDGDYGSDTLYCELPDATYSDTFYFKRNTYLSANASPEPVRKGTYVTVKGTLRYWNPDFNYGDGAIRPLSSRTVKIYFDPAGTKGAVYKGSAKTSSKGVYSKKLKQSTSGTWIVKYAGSSTLVAKEAKDAVKVR
ncbi:hypothetical protein M1843_04805 [Isoptericola sp. 4D.3]|uniref:Uncharacterized protein n=1 Tax=Isoptericola peretonis TaxID=2918523 RepID=A0ABT0J0Q5_9MICO|nr:hypothetical protein [Isoptericola sp. 4D.3]